jgi:uncharacterized protein YpuA (DUF1002 family)
MKKRGLAFLLACIMTLATPMAVMADREDAKLETPYISLGADLKAEERAKVLELLGVTEEELKNYTVAEVTNKDEHKYLDGYLDKSVIGSRALSSVLVVGKESGYGIKVQTQNISYCTVGMYQNALVTAGIQDADIKVAGPFKISGTAALVGAIKSYENMTGETVSAENVDTATNELVVTSQLGEDIGDSEKAEQLIGAVKEKVVEAENADPKEVEKIVTQAAEELEINLSEADRQKIVDLMAKIDGLNLNIDDLKSQAKDLYDKLSKLDLNLSDADKEKVGNFFQRLWDGIVNFFDNFFN